MVARTVVCGQRMPFPYAALNFTVTSPNVAPTRHPAWEVATSPSRWSPFCPDATGEKKPLEQRRVELTTRSTIAPPRQPPARGGSLRRASLVLVDPGRGVGRCRSSPFVEWGMLAQQRQVG